MKHFDYAQCKQKGQIILILIMVMTVALGIGLSIVQKSLVDISTASKVEQSSRAFSAAEAGIEKALKEDADCHNCPTFDNNSSIKEVTGTNLIPPAVTAGNQQVALEYPPLAKEDVAHVWLADLTSSTNPPTEFYMPFTKTTDRGIEIYWGSPIAEKAAIEVKIIYYDQTTTPPTYKAVPYYFDSDALRVTSNGFTSVSCATYTIDTTSGTNRSFYCRRLIDFSSSPPFPLSDLMLIRMRLLYNSTSQPIAVRGYGTCGQACSLPPQAREIISTGVSGETQRKVKLFQERKVVPPFFDYAIFSSGAINKQ